MCLYPGIADGRFLLDEEYQSAALVTEVRCECGHNHANSDEASHKQVSRRALLSGGAKGVAGLSLASLLGTGPGVAVAASPPAPAPTRDAVLFLGTAGGPNVSPVHKQPALAVLVSGRCYLVDCGQETIDQLVVAGVPLSSVRHLFITHHHSDHVAGFPALASLGWVQAQNALLRLEIHGPPPVVKMRRALDTLWSVDIASRERIGVRVPWREMLHASEVVAPRAGSRRIFEDNLVRVSVARVSHGPDVKDAYAYRFDIKRTSRSIVFSGDTRPTDNLVRLAQGADLLVHQAAYMPGIKQIAQSLPPKLRPSFLRHVRESLTLTNQLPAVAKAAQVKRLAMCHYSPPFIPREEFLKSFQKANASIGYRGEVLTPTELDAVELG